MALLDLLGLGPFAAPAPVPPARRAAELARRVRRLEISTRLLADRGVAGSYHSAFKGRGVEFSEVRPYQPGDDVRTIDWNVTARMGAAFVKQYVEERDLTLFLVVDVSGSLGFGSRATLKLELAAEVATLLAFAALRNQDRVGAALVSDRLELFLRPRRRRSQVLRIAHEILAAPAGGGTDLDRAVPAALRALKQRSVVFLLSDFLATSWRRAVEAGAARHDLVLCRIGDPRDLAPPATAPVLVRDAETGRLALAGGARAGRRSAELARAERRRLLAHARRLGVDVVELATDSDYLAPLAAFLERRRRRLAA